jgi:hypothetical protein
MPKSKFPTPQERVIRESVAYNTQKQGQAPVYSPTGGTTRLQADRTVERMKRGMGPFKLSKERR